MLSPAYWYYNKIEKIDYYPDNPESAKKGWADGCRSATIHWGLPGQLRVNSEFNLDPYYVNDPIYRDAWNTATYFCMAKIKNGAGVKFWESYNYLDQRGDSIAYKR